MILPQVRNGFIWTTCGETKRSISNLHIAFFVSRLNKTALLFMVGFLTLGWPCEENFILRNVYERTVYDIFRVHVCENAWRCNPKQQKLIEQSIHSNFICFHLNVILFSLFALPTCDLIPRACKQNGTSPLSEKNKNKMIEAKKGTIATGILYEWSVWHSKQVFALRHNNGLGKLQERQ